MAKKRGKKTSKPKRRELEQEVASTGAIGIRSTWYSTDVATSLTPAKLAALMKNVIAGEAHDYLTVAEEIEERDMHYRSVIGTRKLAISRLRPIVEPADDSPRAQEIADAVRRDIVEHPGFDTLVSDSLDAIAKGYAVSEIMWDTSGTPWVPKTFEWRDPRWFDYDLETGRRLQIRALATGGALTDLPPYKFVVHQPRLKSGLQLRSGLALPAMFLWLVKHSTVTGWAAFIEVFGFPLRIGKYPRNATPEDLEVLKRAVRNIGRDMGAVIPDAMMIDVVAGMNPGGPIEHYERLARWCDEQTSKGVLGQTSTADATPGKLGSDDTQEEVRLDIMEADAGQLGATFNRDLVRPYVDLNWGVQDRYPTLIFPVPRREDVTALVKNVSTLVPLGFPVKRAEMYQRLGLTEPAEGDLVIDGPELPVSNNSSTARRLREQRLAQMLGGDDWLERYTAFTRAERNASLADGAGDLDELLADESWQPLLQPLYEEIERLAEGAGSYDEIQRRLPELLGRLDDTEINRRLAIAQTRARGLGDRDFQAEE